MKAIRVHEQAGISGLSFEGAPDPTPTIGDVLVKVAAVGITHNELDWPLRTDRNGHPRDTIIPGQEVSGVVTALGMGTAGIAVGDEVFGLTDPYRDAAAAEYVAVEARNLARKPRTVDHVHAASVPRAGLTAWQALFDHGKLAKGQTVVIHGAAGAVGSTAVQLARWAGAEVIGTGRSRARQLVKELGADRFIALDEDQARGRGRISRRGVQPGRRRGARPVVRPAQARRNAGLGGLLGAARRPGRHQDGLLHPGGQAGSADRARPPGRRGPPAPQVGGVYPLAQAVEAYRAKAAGGIPGRMVLQP